MNNDAREAALGLLGLNILTPPLPLVPLKRKQSPNDDQDIITNPEAINCICGFGYDDGFSIACDQCSRWCHAACFSIVEGEVPEEWHCWVCLPRHVDRERAVKMQKTRQKEAQDVARKVSPGVERKGRQRASSSAIEGSKRKRRSSINVQPNIEDELVDIDEPWNHSYVPITKDIINQQEVRDKLRRQAQHWRGITAITPVKLAESTQPAQTSIQPLPRTSIRPPSYAMHTTTPIPSSHFITPYCSTITPSSAYLSDPLNSYAHLGMPRPFVHLIGPPLDIALDARITGDESRFVRSGCRPNAVLRPVICEKSKQKDKALTFGVFALRDIKANEEVVLGWEWDDGNAVHNLPALIESLHLFPPSEVDHLRNQMSGILHTLSSTFTTCACGNKAKDCALAQMEAFVDGEVQPQKVDLGPLIGVERGFRTRERVPFSGGMAGVEMDPGPSKSTPVCEVASAFRFSNARISLAGPSPRNGKQRAFGERPGEDGEDGSSGSSSPWVNGAERRTRRSSEMSPTQSPVLAYPTELSAGDEMVVEESEQEQEVKMPLKMRKRWIHKSRERLSGSPANSRRTSQGDSSESDRMDVDDMPPPPIPAAPDHPTIIPMNTPSLSSTDDPQNSPSIPFANLSLFSPVVRGPVPAVFSSYVAPSRSPPSVSPAPPRPSSPTPVPQPQSPPSQPLEAKPPEVPIIQSPQSPAPHSSPEQPLSQSVNMHPQVRFASPEVTAPSEPAEAVDVDVLSPTIFPPELENVDTTSSPPASEEISQVEPPAPPPPPPSPPVPKVKLSLKDFALRKKKQREEELANAKVTSPGESATQSESAPTSPSIVNQDIEAEHNEVSPAHLDSPVEQLLVLPDKEQLMPACEHAPVRPTPLAEFILKDCSNGTSEGNHVHENVFSGQCTPDLSPKPTSPVTKIRAGLTIADTNTCINNSPAKVEIKEEPTPNGLVSTNERIAHNVILPPEPPPPPLNGIDLVKPKPPPLTSDIRRRFSQEDGEIMPVSTISKQLSFVPRSHTPPTQPRSFLAAPISPVTPSPSATAQPRGPSLPAPTYRPLGTRPPPSGPRALRGVNTLPTSTSIYPPSRSVLSSTQFIPRGPSADRDRVDWDRERSWQTPSRARGRGGGSSWAR